MKLDPALSVEACHDHDGWPWVVLQRAGLLPNFKNVKRMGRRESKEKPRRMRSAAVTAAARKRFEATKKRLFYGLLDMSYSKDLYIIIITSGPLIFRWPSTLKWLLSLSPASHALASPPAPSNSSSILKNV